MPQHILLRHPEPLGRGRGTDGRDEDQDRAPGDSLRILLQLAEVHGKEHELLHRILPGLPDGYSQIFRSYVFGPSGFWTMAPLRYAAKFDPFLSLDCAGSEGTGAQ